VAQAPALKLAPYERFDCQGCAQCCRAPWQIHLQPEESRRLSLRVIDAEAGCPFLENSRCQLHNCGKPVSCQVFPFIFTATPEGVEVELSYFCPSVRSGSGRLLEEQRDSLQRLLTQIPAPQEWSGPFLVRPPDLTLGWTGYRLWEAELLRLLERGSPLAVLESAIRGLETVSDFWQADESQLFPDCPQGPPQPGLLLRYLSSLIRRKFLLRAPSLLTGLGILQSWLGSDPGEAEIEAWELRVTHGKPDWEQLGGG